MIKQVLFKIKTYTLLLVMLCLYPLISRAEIVNITTAGTLSTLVDDTERDIKIVGPINGTDVKYLRSLINDKQLTSIDLSDAKIVSGGVAYYDVHKTENDVLSPFFFYDCIKLEQIILPANITAISTCAFAKSGINNIEIPDLVTKIGNDAFANCPNLATVVLGKRVAKFDQGSFFSSNVKKVYSKPVSAPTPSAYLFSSGPEIIVYTEAIESYMQTDWKTYGPISGGLEDIYPKDKDTTEIAKQLINKYFEDAACTILKADYKGMSDETLTITMTTDKMPSVIINTALKIKNNSWAKYEQEFRIHDYNAYSDANYWNNRLRATGGSYMGNPTGIYANSYEDLYVFVDQDVPEDATLYIAGCLDNELISNPKQGFQLVKGLNIIPSTKDALYYILYTANTESCTKKLTEWQNIKIHIEGGIVNGYYDVNRKSDLIYRNLLQKATHKLFTVKGNYSLFNFTKSSYQSIWPTTGITKCISWFDSLTVWQKELMGFCESVSSGSRDVAPYNLSGGEGLFPSYYNNPNFAIEGTNKDGGWANSSTYRTCYNSPECIKSAFDIAHPNLQDDWCANHECGHNNQHTINLEGCTEVSNNLFSNVVRFLDGHTTPSGKPVATTMNDYAHHVPFFLRGIDSRMRMYYQLYLYYHQARKNTSFYPELFKALREDPLVLNNGCNESSLKFVRKACKIANEDLTDFFAAWGFFEPCDLHVADYGDHPVIVKKYDILKTKAEISKYPRKNREILFVEDRAKYLLTNGFFTTAGLKRRESDQVGKCGDLGQFTDYMPGGSEPSSYTYTQADSLFIMKGQGGVGFAVLDKNDNIIFGSNSYKMCVPSCLGNDFTICSVDADGTLHEATKTSDGKVTIKNEQAGKLSSILSEDVIHATISGQLNGTDIKYLRDLINNHNLSSLNIADAVIVSGGTAYFNSFKTSDNVIGNCMFADCYNLISIILPKTITSIETTAFSHSGLQSIEIPDKVTSLGGDCFANCDNLSIVILGTGLTSFSQGVFYSSNVKDVYSKSMNPISPSAYFFSSNPNIHIYKAALNNYRETAWTSVGKLVADLDNNPVITNVKRVIKDKTPLQVIQSGGNIIVNNLEEGEEVTVFSTSGTTIAIDKARNGSVQFDLSPLIHNAAIIATKDKSSKIIIK